MKLKRLVMLSVHTSPLAPMGGKKTGGMNVYVRELAKELGSRGIQVDIFTRRSSYDEVAIDYGIGENVRLIYIDAGSVQPLSPDDMYPYVSEFAARTIAFAMRDGVQYDLIYSHYWLSGAVAITLKESWGTPFIQMFHTLGQMKQRILNNTDVYPGTRIATETRIVEWADRIIAATPAELTQLRWLYRANRRKIEIIPPGVNTARFYPDVDAIALESLTTLTDNHRLLLFVGRIEPLKSVDTIIRALAILKDKHPIALETLRFGIVGGNPDDKADSEIQRLQHLTQTLDLQETVIFLGAKEQEDLQHYYRAATAVIMPSDYESFGMVALEAMASGTPVIATEVGGLAYLVQDNETGYHIPVREPESLAGAIYRLITDEEKSQHMGQEASRLAQTYAWSNIADRLLHVFDTVIKRRRKKSGSAAV